VPKDDGPGRALPDSVLAALIAALDRLEAAAGRDIRVAVQLLIDTGRRPAEICLMPWDCLDQDRDGKYALIYTDFKNNRVGRRLAISDATAELIIEHKQRVQQRFPHTALADLALLPRAHRNPQGTQSISDDTLASAHRRWVDEQQPLRRPDGTEFDKSAVFLYAYRHSYAQRHADAGTPVDVLRDLMGHRSIATTQGYYSVTATRMRRAVDSLAAVQFNGRGEHVWSQARVLLESEHQRLAVGQVAVPFGICTEPSNVKAGGGACPFRFRCLGCGHFRSDPSYLPELRDYLDTLLRDRERIRAATELDDWARAEAMPSDAEITRLRELIRRVEHDLNALDENDRQQIEEAVRIVRRTRQTVHLGLPTTRSPALDPNLEGQP
jgi:Phage integrase family